MSLSNIDKNHANHLIMAINKQNLDHNALEIIRTNYMQYGKLKQIAKQMEQLKKEAEEIIADSFQQHKLQKRWTFSKKRATFKSHVLWYSLLRCESHFECISHRLQYQRRICLRQIQSIGKKARSPTRTS